MFVWVKSRTGNEQSYTVDFTEGMIFDTLKKLIKAECGIRVRCIHAADDDEVKYELRAGAEVPKPQRNEIGFSDDFPYFYSIVQHNAGNLFPIRCL